MANRTIEAVLRLTAKLGNMAAFGHLSGKLADVDRKAKAVNRTQMMMARSSTAMAASLMRYAAPAVLTAGAVAATKQFAAIERRMTRIGINADATKEQMSSAMEKLRQIAQDTMTPVDNVVTGFESLIASGKSLDEALSLLPAVARTAQAADAQFNEMATTADAISGSFGIAGRNMERAFDIIAKGGKAGKFELKDMAAELPSLAPAFAALGYKGEDGLKRLTAALQVVRMEVGTSGEAATSFMDVLSKMQTDTVSNNFKKFGVNIRKEMASAKKNGEDVLESFIRLSREAVKGDMSKLPQLFTDKQMLVGMRALMNRPASLRDLFGELGDASGTVAADLAKIGDDAQASFDRAGNAWEKLKTTIGSGLAPAAAEAMEGVTGWLGKRDAATKTLKDRGYSYQQRNKMMHPLWGSLSDEEIGRLAFDSEWRSDAGRAIAAGPMGKSPERASAAAGANAPWNSAMPIPTARPGAPSPYNLPGLKLPRRAPSIGPADQSAYTSLRPDQINGDLNALIGKIEQGGDHAATKIAESGQQAGTALGDAANAKILSGAAAAGAAFGDAAAARIRSAAAAAASASRAASTDERGPGDL